MNNRNNGYNNQQYNNQQYYQQYNPQYNQQYNPQYNQQQQYSFYNTKKRVNSYKRLILCMFIVPLIIFSIFSGLHSVAEIVYSRPTASSLGLDYDAYYVTEEGELYFLSDNDYTFDIPAYWWKFDKKTQEWSMMYELYDSKNNVKYPEPCLTAKQFDYIWYTISEEEELCALLSLEENEFNIYGNRLFIDTLKLLPREGYYKDDQNNIYYFLRPDYSNHYDNEEAWGWYLYKAGDNYNIENMNLNWQYYGLTKEKGTVFEDLWYGHMNCYISESWYDIMKLTGDNFWREVNFSGTDWYIEREEAEDKYQSYLEHKWEEDRNKMDDMGDD